MVKRSIAAVLLAASLAAAVLAPAQAQHAGHGGKRPAASLAVGAAFAPSGELWIVGLDAQRHLFVQASADDGKTWSPPRQLDTRGDTPAADAEARPKIAFHPQGRFVAITYTQPLGKPYTGMIRMMRSDDGGRTFSAPFTVHRDQQAITHRFDAVAFDARGTLHTLWVDKRDAEASRAAGRKDYRGAAIYRNESTDGGLTFGRDLKLSDHSCECCRIALAPAPDGGLAALWRHVYAPNQRDHAFAPVSTATLDREPVRATFDRWALDACPHHGPGLAAARGGGYHAVWFGERDGVAAVRVRTLVRGRPAARRAGRGARPRRRARRRSKRRPACRRGVAQLRWPGHALARVAVAGRRAALRAARARPHRGRERSSAAAATQREHPCVVAHHEGSAR